MIYKTPLSWRFCGSKYAYIYAIYSIEYRLCYVGQTNDSVGIIGRLNGHLSNNGTFRNHFEKEIGIPLDNVNDLIIISSILSDEDNSFTSSLSSYREGVEYLVKKYLMELMGKKDVFLRIVGDTRSLSTTSLNFINDTAKQISSEIFSELESDYIV